MFMEVFLHYDPDCELQCGLLRAAPAVDISANNNDINCCNCLTADLQCKSIQQKSELEKIRETSHARSSAYIITRGKKIFGPKRGEIRGEWRKLHIEELSNMYSSSNIVRLFKSRRMGWTGHVASMVERRGAYKILVGKPEERRPLGRPKQRWEYNIKMDLQKVGCGGMDWIDLAQYRDR